MSKIKKIAKYVAPIGLSLAAPGLGTAIGTALGAGAVAAPIVGGAALGGGLSAISGGNILKGAVTGGIGGAAGSGFGSSIGQSLGATGATASGIGNALLGAASGLATGGGVEGALTGAALGGGLGYVNSGGSIPGIGNLGGAPLETSTGVAGLQGPTAPSGVLGGLQNLTNTGTGGNPVRLGSLLSKGGDVISYGLADRDLKDIQDMLARQSRAAQAQYQPYAQAGQQALANMQAPSLEALQADPGYQFRLQQGQQALERSLGARGMNQSGAALKAAQEYGQGLADQTYNDYFTRQGVLANTGYNAASGLGSLYTNLGNTQAASEIARINERNRLLSGLGGLFG